MYVLTGVRGTTGLIADGTMCPLGPRPRSAMSGGFGERGFSDRHSDYSLGRMVICDRRKLIVHAVDGLSGPSTDWTKQDLASIEYLFDGDDRDFIWCDSGIRAIPRWVPIPTQAMIAAKPTVSFSTPFQSNLV